MIRFNPLGFPKYGPPDLLTETLIKDTKLRYAALAKWEKALYAITPICTDTHFEKNSVTMVRYKTRWWWKLYIKYWSLNNSLEIALNKDKTIFYLDIQFKLLKP